MALPWTNYSLMRKAVTSNTMPREKEDYRANVDRLNKAMYGMTWDEHERLHGQNHDEERQEK